MCLQAKCVVSHLWGQIVRGSDAGHGLGESGRKALGNAEVSNLERCVQCEAFPRVNDCSGFFNFFFPHLASSGKSESCWYQIHCGTFGANLHCSVACKHDILALDVTVKNFSIVNMLDCKAYLHKKIYDLHVCVCLCVFLPHETGYTSRRSLIHISESVSRKPVIPSWVFHTVS